MSMKESEAFASMRHSEVLLIANFMNDRVKSLFNHERSGETAHRDTAIYGLYMRALSWMLSLKNLDKGYDFQPIVGGVRSLLEAAVDLVLLQNDKSNSSGWKIMWWGESAKLKAAECVQTYYKCVAKKPVPDEYEPLLDYIKDRSSSINDMRATLFNGKHPERWTNRPNLLEDAREADRLHSSEIERHLGKKLEEFYETEYRRLNWNVHGSGLTGVVFPNEVEAGTGLTLMRAFGYLWCSLLAVLCTSVVLKDFAEAGVTDEVKPIVQEANTILDSISR